MTDLRIKQRLPLHEEVMLIALSNETGKVDGNATFYPQIVAGAIIAELVLNDYISIDTNKSFVSLNTQTECLDNSVIVEALSMISASSKKRKVDYWVHKFAGIRDLKKKVAHSLIEKGLLEKMEFTMFWLFTATHYPEKDPRYERNLIAQLDKAIFSDVEPIDLRTSTLVALLHKTRLLQIPFDANALNRRKQRMQEIADGNLVGKATSQIIQQIQTALIVMSIMPSMFVVTTM
jgi:hypothetical protein